jgi:hypothetical protein
MVGCHSPYFPRADGFQLLLCSPQNEDSSFHFDGSGYSVVEKTLRATVTQITLLFSTFSPNGLLLYLASNGTVRIGWARASAGPFTSRWGGCGLCAFADRTCALVCCVVRLGTPYGFPPNTSYLLYQYKSMKNLWESRMAPSRNVLPL